MDSNEQPDSNRPAGEPAKSEAGLWRARGRRLAVGTNVLASVFLAGLLVLMLNYLAAHYPLRWNWTWSRFYTLSEKTVSMLGSIDAQIQIIALFRPSHPLYNQVRNLIREYEYAAALFPNFKLSIEVLDPDRDMARIRALKNDYDVSEVNTVLFACAGRVKYVEAKDLADYDFTPRLSGKPQKMVHFNGEQAFSSAILSVTESAKPIVYFLCGHGERDILDFGRSSGYSTLARLVRRDNVDVRRLHSAQASIPQDCSALVIAGPDRKFSQVEVGILRHFLDVGGRLMLLLDPAMTTGLEPLLADWGVRLAQDIVVGLTLTGRELIVTEYGEHPLTKRLRNVTTSFYMPRSVIPAPAAAGSDAADMPRASVLAVCGKDGWQEFDLDQNPPRFDNGIDRPGPTPIAVAIEKGAARTVEVNLRPTRMVVVGDSYFVSNGGLTGAVGGNRDFFMSALNWLMEREALMTIQPKQPEELHLDMNRRQVAYAFLALCGGTPGLIAAFGLAVWWTRGRSP